MAYGGYAAEGPDAGGSSTLFTWNKLDTSQFRIGFDGIGGGTAVLSRVVRPHGPVLRVTFPTKVTGELSTFITLVDPGIEQGDDNEYSYEFKFRVCGYSGNASLAGEWYAVGPAYLCNQLTGANFYGLGVGASSGGVGGNGRYGRIQAGVQALSGATFASNAGGVLLPGSGGEINTRFDVAFTGRQAPASNPEWLASIEGRTKDNTNATQIIGGVNNTYMTTQLGAFGAGWASQTLDTCGIWILGRAGTTANQWIEFDLFSVEQLQ